MAGSEGWYHNQTRVDQARTSPDRLQFQLQQFSLYDGSRASEAHSDGLAGVPIESGVGISPRQRRGLPLGLSKAQILTVNNTVTIYRGGARAVLPRQRANAMIKGGGRRRQCVGMSKDARRSASKLFQSIDQTGVARTWLSRARSLKTSR